MLTTKQLLRWVSGLADFKATRACLCFKTGLVQCKQEARPQLTHHSTCESQFFSLNINIIFICQIWSIMRSLPCNHISSNRSIKCAITVTSFIIYSLAYNTLVKRNTSCMLVCHLLPGVCVYLYQSHLPVFSLKHHTHSWGLGSYWDGWPTLAVGGDFDLLYWESFSYILIVHLSAAIRGCRAVGDKVTFALSIVTLKNTQEAQGKSI